MTWGAFYPAWALLTQDLNIGSSLALLSKLKICYGRTIDGDKPQVFGCDWDTVERDPSRPARVCCQASSDQRGTKAENRMTSVEQNSPVEESVGMNAGKLPESVFIKTV
jgi:hypothetical protein